MRLGIGTRRAARGVVAVVAVLAASGAAGAGSAIADAPAWHLDQPPTVGGGPAGPLGAPAALQFVAPNRGLLQTGGSGANPPGLWTYDGQHWTLLANVCGADTAGEYGAVAFAGEDDFWTVSDPAPNPLVTPTGETIDNSPDTGTTLCHFQGGRVVASYAVAPSASDAYLSMRAAACLGPNDCWFGGNAGQSGDGTYTGTFHLHWDGSSLTQVWSPQDRAVSALVAFDGTITQTVVLGQRPFQNRAAHPQPPDDEIHAPLVQVLQSGQFVNDPYLTPPGAIEGYNPPYLSDAPPDSTLQEVDALDARASLGGSELWVAGAGAESGGSWGNPMYCCNGWMGTHDPFLAVRQSGGPLIPLTFSDADRQRWNGNQGHTYTFTSVAPIPGSPHEAWVGVANRMNTAGSLTQVSSRYQTSDARLIHVRFDPNAPAGQPNAVVVEDVTPADGIGRGAVRRVACPAANDCWAVTTSGWLLHWSDGTPQPVDTDPAYSQLISIRPPDGRSPQPLPTGDPFDDSNLYRPQPPIIIVPAPPPPTPPAVRHITPFGALIRDARSRAVGQREIELRFELMRPARVGLEGLLHGRVVARTAERRLVPGDQRLLIAVRPGWRPLQLRFMTHELALHAPTLWTAAGRSGGRTVKLAARAPGAGRLTVRIAPDGGQGRGVTSVTRSAMVRRARGRTIIVTVPAPLARAALVVRFSFAAAGAQPGVPRVLDAQRLLPAQ